MRRLIQYKAMLLLLCSPMTGNGQANSPVPAVYQDEFVSVRSGITEYGREPIHLGDPLSLVIDVTFNNRRVRIQDLDQELFQRNWATAKGISLYGPPEFSRRNLTDNRTTIRAVYTFQILDCPPDTPSCPGPKIYELPIFTLGYQIIGDTGEILNSKSVRFRPWPEQLAVTQALPVSHEGPQDFSLYFPDGGLPEIIPTVDHRATGLWTMLTGGVLFLASFGLLLIDTGGQSRRTVIRPNQPKGRWEKAMGRLHKDRLPDDEWADMMRRCITWYCLDVLKVNPYHWLKELPARGDAALESNSGIQAMFMEVLNQESIIPEHRQQYIRKFEEVTGRATVTGTAP